MTDEADIIDFRDFRKKRQSNSEYHALVDAQDNLFGPIEPTFLDILLTETPCPEEAGTFERLAYELMDMKRFQETVYGDYERHDIVAYRKFVEQAAVFFMRNRKEEGEKLAVRAVTSLRDLYAELKEQEPKDERPLSEFDTRVLDEALSKYYQK